ncbi:hypothetical protein, partial [Xenorhabdus littoralis]|uniref:hypothetical protein n=1 Tax=Xenorhabdus littoralis TaxID=2582835 RepID=UPI0029E7D761
VLTLLPIKHGRNGEAGGFEFIGFFAIFRNIIKFFIFVHFRLFSVYRYAIQYTIESGVLASLEVSNDRL